MRKKCVSNVSLADVVLFTNINRVTSFHIHTVFVLYSFQLSVESINQVGFNMYDIYVVIRLKYMQNLVLAIKIAGAALALRCGEYCVTL